ncbi:MAG: MBL fold metallo-hydrolase [Chloroflexi bacterium]|nr:MBL fold metallo-hydrolase [Chloroflexota bacterium]
MDVIWLGQSCFRLRSKEATIVTDPFPGVKAAADIVTLSHAHPQHSALEGLKGARGDFKVLRGPGEYEVSHVLITGHKTFHDAEGGQRLGPNTVYLFLMDGLTLCHLGDLGHPLSRERANRMGKVDVLLVPVGGVNTIGATRAAEAINLLEPKVAIPMHYQTPARPELEPLERFLGAMGLKELEPAPKLALTPATLGESFRVVVLAAGV